MYNNKFFVIELVCDTKETPFLANYEVGEMTLDAYWCYAPLPDDNVHARKFYDTSFESYNDDMSIDNENAVIRWQHDYELDNCISRPASDYVGEDYFLGHIVIIIKK